jgi:hypothetical protein
LQVQEAAKAEVRLCFEDIDLKTEKKKDSEIIIAHIFDMEEEIKARSEGAER